MKLFDAIASRLPAPRLTKGRVIAAFLVALSCDALQILLGPMGWLAPDEVLDAFAFAIITWLIGFHVLLLPTFAVEFIPVVDMLPTWTGCVAAVVALKNRAARTSSASSPSFSVITPPPPAMPPPPLLPGASPRIADSPPRLPGESPVFQDPPDPNPS